MDFAQSVLRLCDYGTVRRFEHRQIRSLVTR